MPRVLLIALILGVTIYALLDWGFNSKRNTPGGLSRWIWLAVIIVLPFLGPLTWVVMRLVSDAEARMEEANRPATPQPQVAPDDDPDFLSDISRKIERRQKKPRPGQGPASQPKSQPAPEDEPGAGEDNS